MESNVIKRHHTSSYDMALGIVFLGYFTYWSLGAYIPYCPLQLKGCLIAGTLMTRDDVWWRLTKTTQGPPIKH